MRVLSGGPRYRRSPLALAARAAKEKLHVGFTTPQQVEDLLGIPLLSSISRMEARDLNISGKVAAIPHYPALKPLSRFSESIRAIRSGLQMTDVDNPPKVVQVTSTVPGEGKTTVALSIAGSAAQSGLKVLFIDATCGALPVRHFGLADETVCGSAVRQISAKKPSAI